MNDLALSIGTTPIPPPGSIKHLTGGLSKGEAIIQTAIGILLVLTVLAALFSLIYAGIQLITSEGDKQKVAAGRNRVYYSIIGLVISLLAFFVINILGDFFNIKLIGP